MQSQSSAVIDGQLSLNWQTFAPIEVPVTRSVLSHGAAATDEDRQPLFPHRHVPRRPASVRSDGTWHEMLDLAETELRFRTAPAAVPDLSVKPGGCLGAGNGSLMIDGSGCSHHEGGGKASWPQLRGGLAARRGAEPAIARARDLATAYHYLDYYGAVYAGTDFLGRDNTQHGSWRADRFIASIAATVIDLGGDPCLLPLHSDYMRVGVDIACARQPDDQLPLFEASA